MKKVKLTKEQAKAIEKIKANQLEQIERLLANPDDYGIFEWSKVLLKLSPEEYYDALFEGYEIEETFNVRDYVTRIDNGQVIKVIGVNREEKYVYESLSSMHMFKDIRHATPEEIAKEKERRWWANHGREVWEIREDDLLEYLGNVYIVDCFDSEAIWFRRNKYSYSDYSELVSFVRKHFKVVCFAEDRKDVGHAG